jgi:hypothetical protein
MHKHDSNSTPQMNWLDLAGTPCVRFETGPLNAYESLEAILATNFKIEPLGEDFWELSDGPSPWNTYWTDIAAEGGGLDIPNSVFGLHWTNYSRVHFDLLTDSDPEEPSDCKAPNCVAAQSTVGHAAAAATTASSLGSVLIVVVP